ncbi:hypothetical protein KUV65_16900 [Maritalea mobilis]|uniref:hypothetical protein n=1 Tax=Maritalea mobilis TaxID=483324 RepID=UPI001C96341B|nr:hypothetical protein [Maritalea mobilis]MBY6203053.1 hypothetical protein [Maritalea mobilis]
MTTDLSAYADLSERLATVPADGEMRLTPERFPSGLAEQSPFDGLVLHRPTRRLVSWAGEPDMPFEIIDQSLGHDWFALPEGYRRVALWMLHLLFSGRDWAGLRLTHGNAQIDMLWVLIERPVPRKPFLDLAAPAAYAACTYIPQEVARHPFADGAMSGGERVAPEDRPMFRFGWSDEAARGRADLSEADQVILSLSPEGLVALAELLLDFARADNRQDEITLEPPNLGFAGTRPLSLEARFWLPGSFAFQAEALDGLTPA